MQLADLCFDFGMKILSRYDLTVLAVEETDGAGVCEYTVVRVTVPLVTPRVYIRCNTWSLFSH